jgi:transcriptional regulator with XRE-family HTH domain
MNRVRPVDQATFAGRRLLLEIGDELREARLRAGLRQADVARALGTSRVRVSYAETGKLDSAPLVDVARHAAAVGLRLHVRLYPAGTPLRDRAQLALLDRFRRRLSPRVQVRLEVPVGADPRDQRAWDMVLRVPGSPTGTVIGVEAITRLRDVQAQLRAAQLKRHDAGVDHLILLIAGTHANRRALAAAEPLLTAAFPIGTRPTIAALEAGRDPGADALILL